MSSVFGYARVVKTLPIKNKYIVKIYDEEYQESKLISSKEDLPIGTEVYWEFDCRTKKTEYIVL